jgi:hypothetical protein
VVINQQITKDFNSHVKKITQRQKDNPEMFKKKDWLVREDHVTKQQVLGRYEALAKRMYYYFFCKKTSSFLF